MNDQFMWDLMPHSLSVALVLRMETLHQLGQLLNQVLPANPHGKLGPSQSESLTKHPVTNPGPRTEVKTILDHLQPQG